MKLATVTEDPHVARRAFLDYRRAVRERANEEDEQLMRGYRALAQGKVLLNLAETMRQGGLEEKWDKVTRWRRERSVELDRMVLVPRLAVCRASARFAYTNGVMGGGQLRIRGKVEVGDRNRRDVVSFGAGCFPVPDGYEGPWDANHTAVYRAMVPLVPPAFRPVHKLDGYHVLWEADWQKASPPAPVDPALLRHIGGDLYAVVAVWDLTDLERAVLSGRSSERS